MPNQQDRSRIGIIAGRSVGKAVERNRAKRLMRAVMHSQLLHMMPGWDIVLIARKPMVSATYQQTQAVLSVLLRRGQLLLESYDDRFSE